MESLVMSNISKRKLNYNNLRSALEITPVQTWPPAMRSFFRNLSSLSYHAINESTLSVSEIPDSLNFQKYPFSSAALFEIKSEKEIIGLLHKSYFTVPVSYSSFYAYQDLESPIFSVDDRSKLRFLHINAVNHRLTIFDFKWLAYYENVIENDVEHRLISEDSYTKRFTKELLQEIAQNLQEQYAHNDSYSIIE